MKMIKILVIMFLLMSASLIEAQEYREIGKRWVQWFPAKGLLQQTSGEVVEFLDSNDVPLKRVTGIFAYNNRLYVFDSATGHAHLYSADMRYLTQLTDPRHPLNPQGKNWMGEIRYGSVISVDNTGRVLLETGSGIYLIDGIQYALPKNVPSTRGTALFDGAITAPRNLAYFYIIPKELSTQLETYSLYGGKISRPWSDTTVTTKDRFLISDDERLVIIRDQNIRIVNKNGDYRSVKLRGIDNPSVQTREEHQWMKENGKSILRPFINEAQLYQDKIYLFMWSNFGHHFMCEFDLNGTMLRAWQVDQPYSYKERFTALTIVFVNDLPHLYAYRKPYRQDAESDKVVLFTPMDMSENAEAVQ